MPRSTVHGRERPDPIWGAGAIGNTVGAFLVRADHEVVFVDIVPEHVAAIRARGLAIDGSIGRREMSWANLDLLAETVH